MNLHNNIGYIVGYLPNNAVLLCESKHRSHAMITKTASKSKKEKGAMQTLYFNGEQTRELLAIAGDAGLILMLHYVAIAHQTNPNMEDAVLGDMLNKSPSTIRQVRTKLTKAGWFKRIKITRNGDTHFIYLVGKQAVTNEHTVAKLGVTK